MKTIILYYTKTGHTLEAAQLVAEGLSSAGAEAETVSADAFREDMLGSCDSLIVGSPCWAGSFGRGVAGPLLKLLKALPLGGLEGKVCGGFSVHAARGGENTLVHLEKLLQERGCGSFRSGPVGKAGTPMSIARGRALSDGDRHQFREYGRDFAR